MKRMIGLALLAASPTAAGSTTADRGDALLRETIAALNTGDDGQYLRFSATHLTATALKEYPAEIWGSEFAKMFADTGGIDIDRIVGEQPGWVQAEGRDRMSGTRQCITLNLDRSTAKPMMTDFTIRGLYDAGPALTEPTPNELLRTLGGLADRYDARGLMSGVMLIAKNDQILFEKAYGFASIAHRDPMRTTTRLNLASIGKSLTGVAVAQLVDSGKLDYDAPVGRYLPDYPDKKVRDQVTLRQLLSHTAGLGPRDYYQYPQWTAARAYLRSVPDYLDLVRKEGITVGAPQGQFLYSNAGYVIAGAIIERVTGTSFYDYVDRHIFQPAGMTGAGYPELDAEIVDIADPLTNLVNLDPDTLIYRSGTPRKAMAELAGRGGPQGGAVMSARDLLKFDQALRSGKLISAPRLNEMMTPVSPSGAGARGLVGDVREGLGIEVVRQNGHLFYGHTGGDLGVASMTYWYPDSGYTIILLTNRDPRAGRVLANVSRALLTRHTIGDGAPPAQHCLPPSP